MIFLQINEAEIERATAEKAHQLRLRWQRMGQIISEKVEKNVNTNLTSFKVVC